MKTEWIFCSMITLLTLSGCGNAQTASVIPAFDQNKVQINQSIQPDQSKIALQKAFQDIQNNLNAIEVDVNNNNFYNAIKESNQLHAIFHGTIHGPLQEIKGESYAADVHSKVEELQDAISKHNLEEIKKLIVINRQNMTDSAGVLHITLNK